MGKPSIFEQAGLYTPNLGFAVARGDFSDAAQVRRFGANAAVGATDEMVWPPGGLYPAYLPVTSAQQMSVVSTHSGDASVNSAAALGAGAVRIFGLNANFDEVQEDVNLKGIDSVLTVNTYARVLRTYALTAGAGNQNSGNLGNINIGYGAFTGSGVLTNIFAQVPAGEGQTLQAGHTIPRGKTGWLYTFDATASVAKETQVRFMVQNSGGVFRVQDLLTLLDGQADSHWRSPLQIPEFSDIQVRARAGAAGGNVSANFYMILTTNPAGG